MTNPLRSTNAPLVVVGSANADIYVEIDRIPKKGETVAARTGQTLAGGKGANQAACGARMSYPTYFVGQNSESLSHACACEWKSLGSDTFDPSEIAQISHEERLQLASTEILEEKTSKGGRNLYKQTVKIPASPQEGTICMCP
eukprot:Gb_38737 [translate_table: standard]